MAFSRTSFTIVTGGQTLIVASVKRNGVSQAVYSNAALTSAVTLPQTITASTVYYLDLGGASSAGFTVDVQQLDGTSMVSELNVIEGTPITISPVPTVAQLAADASKVAAATVNVLEFGAAGDNATDDYAALAAAIAACPAGGRVIVPPGQYKITQTLVLPANITLCGSIGTRWPQYGGIPTFIKPFFGNFTGTALIQATDTDGWRIEDLTLNGVNATAIGGGTIDGISTIGAVKGIRLTRVLCENFSGAGVRTDTNSNGFPGGWEVDKLHLHFGHAGGWVSSNTATQSYAFADSTISNCEAQANGGSTGGWWFDGVATTDFVMARSTWNTGGPGFLIQSKANHVQFTACQTDRNFSDGYSFAASETGTTQPAPHGITMVNCAASRDGKNADGGQGTFAGVRIVGTSTGTPHVPVHIIGVNSRVSKDDDGSGQLSPAYGLYVSNGRKVTVSGSQLGGTLAPVLDDNNAVVGPGDNTYVTTDFATGAVTFDIAPVTAGAPGDNPPPLTPVATDFGYKAWTYDPTLAGNATAPVAGVLYLSRIEIRRLVSVSKVIMGVVSIAGISLTSSQCFIGLYSSAGGANVRATADLSGAFSAGGELGFNLTSAVTLTPGFYWVGLLLNGTTLPTFARTQGQITGFGSSQLTASQRRFGSFGTTQTSLPSLTPASIANVSSFDYWAAVA